MKSRLFQLLCLSAIFILALGILIPPDSPAHHGWGRAEGEAFEMADDHVAQPRQRHLVTGFGAYHQGVVVGIEHANAVVEGNFPVELVVGRRQLVFEMLAQLAEIAAGPFGVDSGFGDIGGHGLFLESSRR